MGCELPEGERVEGAVEMGGGGQQLGQREF